MMDDLAFFNVNKMSDENINPISFFLPCYLFILERKNLPSTNLSLILSRHVQDCLDFAAKVL